ncbi:hypothetical protein UFOVP1157_47 [uncultured Caudovirales phage]|uniref:Uncharacterized protein n=1 Tax=uncultured Caudovirales phage TaxID=2100421 RepID=A0A6J5Q5U0_9CAUD|nr:hypothetical protein UFOVP497_48 [uncultured Caudovirales phage]CAB4164381.1 hypothetical protein UFOVP834_24 [uncultured Caudovirales phage]CAB4172390.1 hypothetical protein UFOVP922_47 [uncultured Caudovirales phage]CAB4177726.1 hypothetical protein UFOVP1006_40 [uncultured Caudovirales phage]CAB4184089.1 hypothetical protein UFOVP1096_40 [uncultured Caudovirales phage]
MHHVNMKRQIAKVQAVQALSVTDARDQVRVRLYEAREYLKQRASIRRSTKAKKALVERARAYLAANAAESGADVLIDELATALDGFQLAGWAEPNEAVQEVHQDLSEFVLDHHSGAGEPVLEVMPVWVSKPMWTHAYCVGDESDQWEEVDIFDTEEQANAAKAKYEAEVAHLEPT